MMRRRITLTFLAFLLSCTVLLSAILPAQAGLLDKRAGRFKATIPPLSEEAIAPTATGTTTPAATTSQTVTTTPPNPGFAPNTPRTTTSTATTQTSQTPSSTPSPSNPPPTTTADRATSSSTTSSTISTTSSTTPAITNIPAVAPVALPTDQTSVPPIIVYSTTTDGSDPTDTPAAASSATSKGFWANKGAVAATFTIVTIVGLVLIFSTATFAMRRRNRRLAEVDFLTEKYPESTAHDDISTHDVVLPAAGDAYPDRQIHYGSDMNKLYPVATSDPYSPSEMQNTYDDGQQQHSYPQQNYTDGQQQHSYPQQNYMVGYPPGTAYAQSPDIPTEYQTEASYYYQTASRSAQSPTPPKLPEIRQEGTTIPPVAYRDFGGRRESWQHSIDSFYGAPGAR